MKHRALLAAFLAAALCGATWAQDAAKPIRIGLIFPLSGGSGDMGHSARIGAQVAVDEINQVGGYLGRKFELVVRDDRADEATALAHARELVEKEKVNFSVGFCNTGAAMNALDVFQTHKSVLMVTCATGTAITARFPPADSYIFRMSPRDSLQTQFLVDEIVRRGLSKVALLVDSTAYGDAGLKDLEAALARAKLKPHIVHRFKLGVKNLDEEMQQMKASGADALIGWTVGPEEGVVAASRAAVGWKVPQFGPWGLSHASAFAASGGKVDGTMMVQTVLPNFFMERNSTFLRNYAKLSKEAPIGSMMSAAQTYDAVYLMLRAMFDSKGDLSGAALKKALEHPSGTYRGVVTIYDRAFSPADHDAVSANMLVLGTWKNNERAYANKDDERKASIIRRKETAGATATAQAAATHPATANR